MNAFEKQLTKHDLALRRGNLQTLQLNVGRKCNQACRHCHVDAAPWRTETLDQQTFERIVEWMERHRPPVVDITGGAPELSPYFRDLVRAARKVGGRVIDRNNLTILLEPGYEDLPEFLAEHEVEIIASLPCYLESNVARQRGSGVFQKSIQALQRLNQAGFGDRFPLNLVYNPVGPSLPPSQEMLESEYKTVLAREYGIRFNRLYTITNQPIARFAEDLRRNGHWDEYLELLVNAFNPGTVDGVMCRSTLSVGYRGELFDCDFNQMLGMQWHTDRPLFLWDITPDMLPERRIATGIHCFACTAGSGSSCSGALS